MDAWLETLRTTLVHLSSPADVQIRYLDNLFGPSAAEYGVDELALEFDDVFRSHEDMRDQGFLSASQISAIEAVNAILSEWSGQDHVDFWNRASLASDSRWMAVRSAALAALATL